MVLYDKGRLESVVHRHEKQLAGHIHREDERGHFMAELHKSVMDGVVLYDKK